MLDPRSQKIMVGVTADEDVEAALHFAAIEARRRGVGVHLVHAVHPVLMAGGGVPITVEESAVRKLGLQALADAAQALEHELGADLPVSTEFVQGPVAQALVKTARGAGLVVLQHQRMGRPGRVRTLSTTNPVAALSASPVVAVPSGWKEEEARGMVTVAVDEGGGSAEVVRAALAEARTRSAKLQILHAWHYNDAYDDVVFAGEAGRAHAAELARSLASALAPVLAEREDVETELTVRHGRAADVLVSESRRSSLLVLGRHQSEVPLGPHLGSLVRAVLRHSECPVMVVDAVPAGSPAVAADPVAEQVRTFAPGSDTGVAARHAAVVIGVDGSRSDDAALHHGVEEAHRRGVAVRLAHVVPDCLDTPLMLPLTHDDYEETGTRILRGAMTSLRAIDPHLDAETVLLRGARVQRLVHATEGASLLVVGQDDRPLLQRVLLGNTASGVAARAWCPVIAVPVGWGPGTAHGTVLVGVKSSAHATELLREAFAMAARRGNRLLVMHAWKLPGNYDDIIESRVEHDEWTSRATTDMENLLRDWRAAYPQVPVEISVVHDHPAHALAAHTRHADLIALGRRGHGVPAATHLGSTARALLHSASCPVMVVPPR